VLLQAPSTCCCQQASSQALPTCPTCASSAFTAPTITCTLLHDNQVPVSVLCHALLLLLLLLLLRGLCVNCVTGITVVTPHRHQQHGTHRGECRHLLQQLQGVCMQQAAG
jgi:hypothetical protein